MWPGLLLLGFIGFLWLSTYITEVVERYPDYGFLMGDDQTDRLSLGIGYWSSFIDQLEFRRLDDHRLRTRGWLFFWLFRPADVTFAAGFLLALLVPLVPTPLAVFAGLILITRAGNWFWSLVVWKRVRDRTFRAGWRHMGAGDELELVTGHGGSGADQRSEPWARSPATSKVAHRTASFEMPRDSLPAGIGGLFGAFILTLAGVPMAGELASSRGSDLLIGSIVLAAFLATAIGAALAGLYRLTFREWVHVDPPWIEVEQRALGCRRVRSLALADVVGLAVDVDHAAAPLASWATRPGLVVLRGRDKEIRFGGSLSERQAHRLVEALRARL